MRPQTRPKASSTNLVAFVVGLAALYFAQAVLLPVAIAVLMAFALMPIVGAIERRTGRRWIGVVIAMSVTAALLAGGVTLTVMRSGAWLEQLPTYRHNLTERLKSVRAGGAMLNRVIREVEGVADEAVASPADGVPGAASASASPSGVSPPTAAPAAAPAPATPAHSSVSLLAITPALLHGVSVVLITAFMATVILIFKDDLRDRLVRVLGTDRLSLTQQALDQASQRVSRYLLAQVGVNTGFGICIGAGLALCGLPNGLLIGVAAALLRFVPFLGPIAGLTIGLLATASAVPGAGGLLSVLLVFVCSEILAAAVVEPWLYGHHAGLSPLGVVVAVLFWGWLWGIPGLLVAVPLTVCVVLLTRHFPSLGPLGVLLGDEPALTPEDRFHHRLFSADEAGARELLAAAAAIPNAPPPEDALWAPSLRRVAHEFRHADLPDQLIQTYLATAGALLDDSDSSSLVATKLSTSSNPATITKTAAPERPLLIVSPPTRLDHLAALVLRTALAGAGPVRVLPIGTMLGEMVEAAESAQARGIIIANVRPTRRRRTWLLARGLGARLASTPIIVADLTGRPPAPAWARSAKDVRRTSSVQELREAVGLARVEPEPTATPEQKSAPEKAAPESEIKAAPAAERAQPTTL